MNATLEKAIEALAARITQRTTPDEAMKLAQAALNLAHTSQVLIQVAITK